MDEVAIGAAGLLDGLDAAQRRARVSLIQWLLADGATREEIDAAVRQHRLYLLPMERALHPGGDRCTLREVGDRVGLDVSSLNDLRRALGLAVLDPDDPSLTPEDAASFEQAALAVEAGLPLEGVLEVIAALGVQMPGVAATMRQVATRLFVSTDDERRTAVELAVAARDLLPLVVPVLEYSLRVHLEHQVVRDYAEHGPDRDEQQLGCVGFADLVGFTRLSQAEGPGEVGALNDRLAGVAREVLDGRSRLVKTVGDAVMITAPSPAEVATTLLSLLRELTGHDADRSDGPALRVRAGMAYGPVLYRAGDVFGATVNLASRLTDQADPDTLVCDTACHDALGDDDLFSREPVGPFDLEGISAPQHAYALTTAGPSPDAPQGDVRRG